MKTNSFFTWKTVLALASLPLLAASLSGLIPTTAIAQSADAGAAASGADVTLTNPAAPAIPVGAPSGPIVPPDMKLYGGTAEIVKLAQAGVGENVMLSFVTNAAVRFALTPNQIIYLNDLGVSSAVVSAMLQHDADESAATPVPAPADTEMAVNPPGQPGPDMYPAEQPAEYPPPVLRPTGVSRPISRVLPAA